MEAGRLCWSMLGDASRLIELGSIDEIVVFGPQSFAHVAMLARQLPSARFRASVSGPSTGAGLRMLWLVLDDAGDVGGVLARTARLQDKPFWDVMVVAHPDNLALAVVATIEGYARIGARRHGDMAVSVFGRDLGRDVFRDRNRQMPPVRLVSSRICPRPGEL
jgi:hypothetical protein